eukprot:6193931-Pleurochrysis_carterae.AAC.1
MVEFVELRACASLKDYSSHIAGKTKHTINADDNQSLCCLHLKIQKVLETLRIGKLKMNFSSQSKIAHTATTLKGRTRLCAGVCMYARAAIALFCADRCGRVPSGLVGPTK